MKILVEKVCDLAIKVGRYQAEQRKSFDRSAVESKRSHDYVSYVDRESEIMIVNRLRELLPEASFITEEKTISQVNDGSEYQWIVDPLDGTTNFIHDFGPWAVCIALKHGEELVMGVVYEVVRQELFYAYSGGGAWLREADGSVKQLSVSNVNNLDQALIIVGFPYNADEFRDLSKSMIGRLYGRCASLRSLGSAETEFCYVAAGRVDVYFESYLQRWDVAAGAVILREAGGMISNYKGENTDWESGREVLATNGKLHAAMVDEFRQSGELNK